MRTAFLVICNMIIVTIGIGAVAQNNEETPIQDNSFLVEEAYNQDAGVVQHINTWMYMYNSREWFYTFTQEWPVPDQLNQLSYSIPVSRVHPDAQAKTGLGDIALNYRVQAYAGPVVFIAPRLTLLLPTGDYKKGVGAGSIGIQLNYAMSLELGRYLAAHINAGFTYTPLSKITGYWRERRQHWTLSYDFAGSLVFLAHHNFNLLVEGLCVSTETVRRQGGTIRRYDYYINPGLRFAVNHASGLQVVPGIAFPVGFGSARGNWGFYTYLSFEHPMWKPKE